MTERGCEPRPVRNGSITATKGDAMVRFVPLADHIVHIDTPTVTAMVREGATAKRNACARHTAPSGRIAPSHASWPTTTFTSASMTDVCGTRIMSTTSWNTHTRQP